MISAGLPAHCKYNLQCWCLAVDFRSQVPIAGFEIFCPLPCLQEDSNFFHSDLPPQTYLIKTAAIKTLFDLSKGVNIMFKSSFKLQEKDLKS